MTTAIVFLTFASAFSLAYWLVCPREDVASYQARLMTVRDVRKGVVEDPGRNPLMSLPFRERVIGPVLDAVYERVQRWAPAGIRQRMASRLDQAGRPFGVGRLIALKAVGCSGAALAYCGLIAASGGIADLYRNMHLVAFATIAGYMLPDMYVNRLSQTRKGEIRAALPDVLDLLCVSVEAGLGFDGAIQKVSEKFKGAAGEEFREFLKEVRLGKSRVDALRALSERAPVDDLKTFTASVIQAEQLGVSLARVLKIQSEQMRLRRKQRAEELAMQTPVKMLLPLVFFVFPTIFIVLLGPMAVQALTTLRILR
ncbi:MAG: type II secretion system F family protein [Bacillota bacterium]